MLPALTSAAMAHPVFYLTSDRLDAARRLGVPMRCHACGVRIPLFGPAPLWSIDLCSIHYRRTCAF